MIEYLSSRASAVILLACLTVPLFYLILDSYQVDFRAFYVAGTSASRGLDPYRDNHTAGDRFTDPINQLESSRWVYPPSALFFVSPFAKLRYTPARLLFGFGSVVSLAWVLLYLSGKFNVADSWVAASYLSVPVLACVERGQIDLLVLFLLVLTYAGGKRFWAGIPLGIAVAIKVFPAAILFWFLLERRFRDVAVTLVTVSTIVLLSTWRYGLAGYLEFWRNLANLAPGALANHPAQQVDLIHQYGGLIVDDRWLALTHGFIGSYNNPLVLLGNVGTIAALMVVVTIALFLHYKRLSTEVSFFSMVLASQIINTRLWTMGMVMYLPICLVVIGKARSTRWILLLMLPLFLPAQVRLLGVSPRLVLAITIIAFAVYAKIYGAEQHATGAQRV